jgi:hypothetical protein
LGFVGRLGDMPFQDIVQMLSMSQRTGKLTLTHGASKALLLFRQGEIIGASCDVASLTLGEALLARQAITQSVLALALEVQQSTAPVRLLGTILVDMNAVRPETIEEVLREQIQNVVREVITWTDGAFRFERLEDAGYLDVGVGDGEILLKSGLRADQVMLDAAQRLDETGPRSLRELPRPLPFPTRDREVSAGITQRMLADLGDTLTANQIMAALTQPAADDAESPGPPPASTSEVVFLKSIIDETQSLEFVGEIGLMIMRCGARIVRRGILFAVSKGTVRGVGDFGLNLPPQGANELVRRISVPLDQPSVFRTVVDSRRSFRGRLVRTFWDDYLARQLGGEPPDEVIAVPMVVNGTVVSIFYGDNGPSHGPVGSVDMLELLMVYSALGMEKMLNSAKATF